MADEIEITATINSIVKNPIPWQQIGITGLHLLIPILGPISLLGWQRRIYEEALRGNTKTIPTIHFMDDLKYGVQPFVALLNSIVVVFAFFALMATLFGCGGLVVLLLAQVSPDIATIIGGLGLLVGYLGYLLGITLLSLGLNVINVELQRRGYEGDLFPILHAREIFWLLRHNTKSYLLAFVGVFVSGLFGMIGAFACYVGIFFSLPLGMIGSARILAQWNQSVERKLIRG